MIDNNKLKALIKFLVFNDVVANQTIFAQELGYEKSTISGMVSGKKPITEAFANKVSETFEVNIEWLRTGEGEMLKKSVSQTDNPQSVTFVPLLPISAQGGRLNDFVESVRPEDCEKLISPIKGADFAITVSGDSMAPEYPSGSKILIKKINERSFIEWGRCYVLDTCNGTVVKKLDAPCEPNKNCGLDYVTCVSVNPAPIYKPFHVPLEDIYGIYRVMLMLTEK